MKNIIHSNGFVSVYDDTLVKGDLITTYYNGFYEFEYSQDRGPNSTPLYYFRLKYDAKGNPRNSKKIKSCDAGYCRRANETINRMIEEHQRCIDNLRRIF